MVDFMDKWRNGLVPTLHRSYLLLAYLVLVMGIVISFMYMDAITNRIERESLQRTYENCQVTNNNLALVMDILEVTDPDLVDQFEERLRPIECPPNPNEAPSDLVSQDS